MATVDEILMTMADTGEETVVATDEVLVIDPNTRQINLPGSELIFGVESDTHSERKYFRAPRMVGNGLDLASCFIRVNFRNGNGKMDSYLVNDVVATDDTVTFSWELSRKVTEYKGTVMFVVCACRPGATAVEWNTTQATGIVLAGLEPDSSTYEAETADVVAQLLAMVEAQTVAVENVGAAQVAAVQNEGATQVSAVEKAASDAESAAVAEIEAKGVNTLASIPDDYTALGEAVDVLTRGRAPGIVCEAAGSAVVVNDASNQAVQGLRIFGRSTQTGTPTPTTPVEIVSVEEPVVTVCGKNLCSESGLSNMGVNGTASTYDTTTHTITMDADSTSISGRYCAPFKKLTIGKMYTLSFSIRGTEGKTVKCGWDKKNLTITLTNAFKRYEVSLTVTSEKEPIVFYSRPTTNGGLAAGEHMQFSDVQIELGNVATEYEPYKALQTVELTHTLPGIPVTSGGNYTDSDGQQWICDEVDFERGVYVQRIGVIGSYANEEVSEPYLSSTGELSEGATVLYALATPIETPLSETELAAWRTLHTNKPNTTVLNDQGAHMAVAYVADTKLYIDNKINALLGEA